jgi:GDP-4-dehydro-6-deoxy-D-mannose reductase
MTRTLVVTGANGFVGAHVAELARADGTDVWAVGRESVPDPRLAPHCSEYFSADLAEEWPIPAGADAIIHLAGLAAVGPSFDDPQRYLSVNSAIMTTMSESLLSLSYRPRVVVVSSGTVYAPPTGAAAIAESHVLSASSPYAVAKILVETQSHYYSRRGIDTVVARPFNHIGPGQGAGFLVPDLAEQLRHNPSAEPLIVGDLSTARDYTDVRDVAAAYLLLAFAESHRHPVYNVASGASHSGVEVLETLVREMSCPRPDVQIDPRRVRPNDIPDIRGDAARLREEFGWGPRIDWRTSIADYLAGARA